MATRVGKQTIVFSPPPVIQSFASVVSKKEGKSPIARHFDVINEDTAFGEQTWEKAESHMHKQAVAKALEKADLSTKDIHCIFAGDLLNQCIASCYGIRELGIPFMGVYGACSTMAEALCLSAMFIDSGCGERAVASTSSHFCSAERQFRFPLEYGGQRPPTSQWTVTGSGACVVSKGDAPPYIRAITIGKIEDLGIKDANNMGAAMAPAAASTIKAYFEDTQTSPNDYDMIATGDLGQVGTDILHELLNRENIDLGKRHTDCGLIIYNRQQEDVHAGGSGCGCSASVLCSYILNAVKSGELQNVLFIATGALMSPTSVQQGESIPGIAHLVHISNTK